MRRVIQEEWAAFERKVLPVNCSAVQRQEMRRAFYAGAMIVFDAVAHAMSDGDEMTPADEQLLIDLAREREEYLALLALGRA